MFRNSFLLIVISHSLLYSQGFYMSHKTCSTLMCRPGRECRHPPGESPKCACILQCPDHWKPVCGSDGVSYDNHCSLHRAACVSGAPVSQIHSGFCRRERGKLQQREKGGGKELEFWKTQQTPSPPAHPPAACYETNRNRLRDSLMTWFQLEAKKQVWYSAGMSHNEALIGHFFSMDQNRDNFLDSMEMADFIDRNWTEKTGRIRDSQLRQLCLDALVEEGDKDMDWRLSLEEFKRLFSNNFKASHKLCSLSNKTYQDGSTTRLECNSCVCASGKWICSSTDCHHTLPDNFYRVNTTRRLDGRKEEYVDLSDEYNEDDYDDEEVDDEYNNPEDDPHVRDINWF